MRNWEEKYNNFNKEKEEAEINDKYATMQLRYDELKNKISKNEQTEEENKEFKNLDRLNFVKQKMKDMKKLENLNNNIPKVENLIKYRKKLQDKLNDLKDIKNTYENKDKLEQDMKKYSKRQEEISKRQKEIKLKIKDDEKISKEDIKKLQQEQLELNSESDELTQKIDDNNSSFVQNEQKLQKIRNLDVDQIDNQIFEISSKISKCNFVAGKLMEGFDLESDFIKEKLTKQWKDRRFKSKDLITTKKKLNKNDNKLKQEDIEKKEEFETIWSDSELKNEAEKNTKKELPITEESFEEAFPRLSKILPKFIKESKLGKAMINAKQKRQLKNFEKAYEEEVNTQEEVVSSEKNDFKDNLKVDYNELLRAANGKMLDSQKDKLSKMKEDAIKREDANKGLSQEEKLQKTANEVDIEVYKAKLNGRER